MKVPEPEEELPSSWKAIRMGLPVQAADGSTVGTVIEVLGSQESDIFHGLVIRTGAPSREVEVLASQVRWISNRCIELVLDAEEVRELPQFQAEASFRLGFDQSAPENAGWIEEKPENPK